MKSCYCITDDIQACMAHMKIPRRIWEHWQYVELVVDIRWIELPFHQFITPMDFDIMSQFLRKFFLLELGLKWTFCCRNCIIFFENLFWFWLKQTKAFTRESPELALRMKDRTAFLPVCLNGNGNLFRRTFIILFCYSKFLTGKSVLIFRCGFVQFSLLLFL